jgi:hypothetical protein
VKEREMNLNDMSGMKIHIEGWKRKSKSVPDWKMAQTRGGVPKGLKRGLRLRGLCASSISLDYARIFQYAKNRSNRIQGKTSFPQNEQTVSS